MSIHASLRKLFAMMCISGASLIGTACTSNPATSADSRTQVLQSQIDDLDRELMLIHSATGQDQLALMHQYWDMLQKQLAYVHDLPGIHGRGCADWTFNDPHFSSQSGFNNSKPCPVMHGTDPATFAFPDKMTPRLFEFTMGEHLNILKAQVLDIAAETDATARQDLMRQNYETRYQDIQIVLGRGWMWTARSPGSLPDAGSAGAQLLSHYCSQCHMAPTPDLRTRAEWGYITNRMHDIISAHTEGDADSNIHLPSADELAQITSYLEVNATK